MPETNSALNITCKLVNSDDGSEVVYLTKDGQVPIPNDLTLSITNPTPIEFINTGGFTPSTPPLGIGAPVAGQRLDRIYIWFLWGGHDAVVGIPSVNDHGQVTDIPVVQGGFGYSDVSPPTLQINGGSGRGLEASVMVKSDGSVSGIEIINPGSGYQVTDLGSGSTKPSPPTVSIPQLALGNALCTFDQAKGITVVAADAMTGNTWYVSNPNFDHATIGVYWTLFPKTRATVGLRPSELVQFRLTGIYSNALEGAPILQVELVFANDKVTIDPGSRPQVVTKYHPPEVRKFTIDPPDTPLPLGHQVRLHWIAWGADYVVLNEDSAHLPPQSGREGYPYTLTDMGPDTSMTIQLEAFPNDGQPSAFASRKVLLAPTIGFKASPLQVPFGDPWTLVWNVTQASQASIDQGIGKISLPVDQYSGVALGVNEPQSCDVGPDTQWQFYRLYYYNKKATYTLTATGNGVTSTQQVDVQFSGLSFFVSVVGAITDGNPRNPVTLTWLIEGPSHVSIDQGIGHVNVSDRREIIPSGTVSTYTFTLGLGANAMTISVNLHWGVLIDSGPVLHPVHE